MSGKVHPRPRLGWMAGLARTTGAVLAALAAVAGGAFSATHYPPGAICYDCHAVSKSKMVAGTHLLRKSDRSVALGIDQTNPQAPCLLCHDRNATPSVVNRDRMKGVWDHFDATSTSKHRAEIRSGFGDQASLFDCRDCHTGIDVGVVSDGAGNARVHNSDASGTTRLNVAATLVGWLASGYDLSAHTCNNAACHGGTAPNAYGTYAARPAHGMARTTLAGGAVPTACAQCHGTHNSYQNTSLITLRTDGTTSNRTTDPLATRVTPEKCGICHVQDDGPGGGAYALKGHGQGTIASGSLACTACHAENVAHSFSKDAPGTNPLRFKFAEITAAQSAIRQRPPYDQVYSICLTCHAPFSGKAHGGAAAKAGCNDCHEPHGTGVGANAAMIREEIPKVDPAGNPVYGDGSASAPYDVVSFLAPGDATYKVGGAGLCDNRECHQGRVVNGDFIYPLSTFLTGGRHSEGDRPTGADYNCQECHKHLDSAGSWGARDSCTSCHGQPPPPAAAGYTGFSEATTGHRKHAGDGAGQYRYDCSHCHGGYPGSHLNGGFQDVLFGVLNPSGAYNSGPATCAGLYCHSDGQSTASVATSPAWNAGPLTCRGCHGGVEGPTRIATVSHPQHLASGTTCAHCHADTVATVGTDTTTVIAGVDFHVNGVKSLKASGTFAGQPITFATGGAATCTNISCHNGGNANWGAALGCSDCHFRTAAQEGDRDNFVYGDGVLSAVSSDEWATTGHGRPAGGPAPSGNYPSGNPAANFSGPAADPRGCAYCHDPAVGHGVSTNPFRLANQGVRSGTGNEHRGWNDACLVCHGTGSTGYDPDGTGGAYTGRNGTRNVGENHYGLKHDAGRNGGAFCWDCHDPHGDDQHYMIHSGDGTAPGRGVTDVSDGLYGIPVSSRPVTGLNVATGGYTSADLANEAKTGLCQTCHARPGTPLDKQAQSYNRNTFTPLAEHNGADTLRCTACHTHSNAFAAACNSCHGGATPGQSPAASHAWPDGITTSVYPDRAGAHAVHVAAIGTGNASCVTCHPGNPPATHPDDNTAPARVSNMDLNGDGTPDRDTAARFLTMSGATDSEGRYNAVTQTCLNIDCHGGATTLPWTYAPDTAAPTWATTSGIAAADAAQGGVLTVTWNMATDAYPSNPVTYDLYLSTTNSAAAVFGGAPIFTGLTDTTAVVTGLANGTTYYFGVRAKDSWVTPNVTTNTDISVGRAPTGTGSSGRTYILTKRNSGTIYGTTAWNGGACGTATTSAADNPGAPATIPYPWRGGLEAAVVCGTSSTLNFVSNSSPNSGGGTAFENMLAFYTTTTYPLATIVTGAATGTNLWMRGSSGTEDVRLWLASSDPTTGALTVSAQSVTLADIGTTLAAKTPDLSAVSVTVAAGARLALLVTWADVSITVSNLDRIMVDNVAGQISQIAVNEVPVDATPPAWTPTAGVSGITVLPRGDGSLAVNWGTATDSGTPSTPPVFYDLYRAGKTAPNCTDAAQDLWNVANLYASGLSVTSYTDASVALATDYCYGVRVRDSYVTPNYRTATDAAFGQASQGASFGCNSCHNSPPSAGANAGSHAAHANSDANYTECNFCHPGTTSYTNSHQDGVGQLAFDGTAVNGVYGAGLTYTDNAVTIYSDANGYGILTGSAGDGIDNGTCSRGATSATQCHGGATADPIWGGTLPGGCGSCHNATGKQASAAPTVTMTSPHTTGPSVTGCTSCHSGHFKGNPVQIPLPPASWSNVNLSATNMQTALGITYTTTGGIHLGGAGTVAAINTKRTEAEICWGCHDAAGVSEWGYNTKTSPVGFPVVQFPTETDGLAQSQNYGWIYSSASHVTRSSDWTAGYWKDQYDPLIQHRIVSVHTASLDPAGQISSVAANVDASGMVNRTSPKLENRAFIRCSYCHDVHGLRKAQGASGLPDPLPKPYLRGTWKGNPYPAELPPRSSYTYTTRVVNSTAAAFTPRGVSTARNKGGYFIDQNSGNPTSGWTLADSAGLCTLCHGTGVDSLKFYASSSLWLRGNGHANAAVGGTGAGKSDLFSGRRSLDWGWSMGMQTLPGSQERYFCEWSCDPNIPQCPELCGSWAQVVTSGWYGTDFNNWYGFNTVGGVSGPGSKAHQFSCSKCHTPHASGLPALLTHNCVDPAQGNWSTRLGRVNPLVPQATNCHRKTLASDGWHRLAPGQ